jgi:hypothetical protein
MIAPGKKIRGARGFPPYLPCQQFSKTPKSIARISPCVVYFAENLFSNTSAKGGLLIESRSSNDNGLIIH